MFQRSVAIALVFVFLLGRASASFAISWDDAGNSASKLWSDNGNWSPDGPPDSLDVFIGNFFNATNDTTLVDQFYSIDSLTITNGADVVNSTDNGASNDYELLVNGDTTVSDSGSSIIIYGGDLEGLDTNNLTINDGASVILNSTTAQGTAVVEVDGGAGTARLEINTGGTLIGTGRIDLESVLASPTTVLINNGTITANTGGFFLFGPPAGTLQITANDPEARFDWDGGGNGTLQANGNQTLDIDVSPGLDGWSGTMNLNTGSTIDIAHVWSMDSGTINANTAAFGLVIGDPNPGPAAHIAGASWSMSGGTMTLADSWDSLQFDSPVTTTGGTIANSGTVIFNNTATIGAGTDFQMNGADASITVNDGVTVNIDDANFNLDGNGFATNVTTVGDGAFLDLDVDFALADEDIDGTVNLNGGELNVSNTNGASADDNWRINSGATVNVNDAVSTSDLDGGDLEIFGTINVNANADLLVNPTSTAFRGSATANVAAGAELNVGGPSTYESSVTITGAGTFSPGTATIGVDATDTENVVWGTNFVNYDDGDHVINEDSTLTVNADSIEAEGTTDGIDNETTIEDGAVLTFNLTGNAPVVFDNGSVINYNGNSILDTFLGASSSPLEFHGTLNANGDGRVEPRLQLNGATVNINDVGERLRLSGGTQVPGDTNTINNSTINGPGVLQLDNGTALRGTGTINAVIDDNGSGDIIAVGGVLTIGGDIVDIGRLGTSGATAVLNISNPWNTSVTNEVRISQGRLEGASIHNDGPGGIHGLGLVVAPIRNDTVISADLGGTLSVNNFVNDWDGPTGGGTLRAVATSTLELVDNAPFLFTGSVEADNATVHANGFELEFDPGSTLALSNGGVYRSTNATDIGGTVLVGAGTASRMNVSGTVIFENGSSTTLTGDLELDNPHTRMRAGAAFAGGGSLINQSGRTLSLDDGANVAVLIENQGATHIEETGGVGRADASDFMQTAAGTLHVDLSETGLNDFDRLVLSGAADLAGDLDIDLLLGFVPSLGDMFNIVSTAGGVLGSFDSIMQPASMPAGLEFTVNYLPTIVQLEVVDIPSFTADFDNDGDVDGDDLNQWQGDYGGPGSDANGDGESAGIDLLTWQLQNSSGVPLFDVFPVSAVPEPSTLMLAGLAASLGLLSTNRKK